jgi:hypothetical protein
MDSTNPAQRPDARDQPAPALRTRHRGYVIIAAVPASVPRVTGTWYVTAVDQVRGFAVTWYASASAAGGITFAHATLFETPGDFAGNAERALVDMNQRAGLATPAAYPKARTARRPAARR